jgi:hypothetical protein
MRIGLSRTGQSGPHLGHVRAPAYVDENRAGFAVSLGEQVAVVAAMVNAVGPQPFGQSQLPPEQRPAEECRGNHLRGAVGVQIDSRVYVHDAAVHRHRTSARAASRVLGHARLRFHHHREEMPGQLLVFHHVDEQVLAAQLQGRVDDAVGVEVADDKTEVTL